MILCGIVLITSNIAYIKDTTLYITLLYRFPFGHYYIPNIIRTFGITFICTGTIGFFSGNIGLNLIWFPSKPKFKLVSIYYLYTQKNTKNVYDKGCSKQTLCSSVRTFNDVNVTDTKSTTSFSFFLKASHRL